MSFLIDWSLLTNGDGTEADNLLAFLNTRFQQIDRPPFLGPLAVTDFDFGDVPPEIKITDICDPSPEFYLPEEEDEWGRFVAGANAQAAAAAAGNGSGGVNTPPRPFSPGAEYGEGHFASRAFEHGIRHRGTGALQYAQTMQRPSDAQVELQIVYKGNMRLGITTELIVNQPTPAFMVLPLNLTLTGFHFTATALISYLGDRINFCFKEADTGATILQDVSIDSEVGDGRKQVLKNVGRIERFIIDQLRKVIQDFLVFPNHQSLHLRPETEDDGYSERDGGSSGSSGDSGSWTGSEEGSEEG
ncbi:uncharacterized protein EV422DRAFT_582818 [Fimicolochytrium jonesii]|uniref:uncharacterized protein n=1 Tax=Fimicolochytrium jonesii TaxID=1396493 RepID=UPI0022FEA632|nr:uncharacterized protein EV422DRAFT_582818 [Fimicolochytrium jonesii]KAI8827172.1 hypothetical protein EV422DRAFT_582818 [Fimicolochytrium jonesii]